MSADRDGIAAFLDALLEVASFDEASLNGLQVEGAARVDRLAVAVDAAGATIDAAAAGGCQLLLVHHGLLWGGPERLVGVLGSRVRRCFAAELSVYAAHLPLDAHPELGNNALLVRELGAAAAGSFGEYGGVEIGVLATFDEPVSLDVLAGRLAEAGCENHTLWPFGPGRICTLAVVTGSGCSLLGEAAAAGADCFVTGEPKHGAYHEARDLGISCAFAGHYATETFGVRAVGDRLADEFDLETVWIDHPTGV